MDKPEFRVERGPAVKDEAFAVGMAKLLEREGRTIAAAELRRLSAVEAQRDALLEALRALVCNEGLDAYSYLDKGIGTATAAGKRWLNARAAIKTVEGEK